LDSGIYTNLASVTLTAYRQSAGLTQEFISVDSKSGTVSFNNWIHFGWQGIEWEMPEEWTLGKIEGDRANGYLRIDDEDMVRLEARWHVPKSGKVDIEAEAEKQIREIEKKTKKSKQKVIVKRKVRLVQREDSDWECYHMRTEFHVWNLVNHCHICGRVILLRLFHLAKEDDRALAERVFGSFIDHQEDCHDHWDVYGLSMRLPTSFELDHPSLKTGEIHLQFKRRREIFIGRRISLAELQLREMSLKEWSIKRFKAEWQKFRWQFEESEFLRHESCFVRGYARIARQIWSPLSAKVLKCRVWYCKDSDKLFILHAQMKDEESDLFEEVCASIHCH